MNLVEKINQVEIKADTRISEADRAFCERQQRAYDEGTGLYMDRLHLTAENDSGW